MKKLVDKEVVMTLVGLNGNAYSLMGAFQRKAKEQGWCVEEIDLVINAAMVGDYNDLVSVLDLHTTGSEEE